MRKLKLIFSMLVASMLWLAVDAQTEKISGTVVSSEEGKPLEGVTVSVKGTDRGTLTNAEGKFTLVAAEGETLVISSQGYQQTEIKLGKQTSPTIRLSASSDNLKAVVVIGYGTAKKKELVGAASVVSARDAGANIATTPAQLLIGKAAGVQVLTSSGVPGSASQIIIRGTGSFTSVDPLYVIDGIQANGNIFNSLNSQDIETITILKDASSTAIYGAAAANGVVIVTTKKFKSGAPRVSVTTQFGVSKAWKMLDLLNAQQYVDLMKDYAAAKGVALPSKLQSPYVLVDRTDWQKEMFRKALSSETDASISGGSEKVLYNLSLGYMAQQATLRDYLYKRFTARFSLDETLGRFHFGQTLNIRYNKSQGQVVNLFNGGVATHAPYEPIYDSTVLGGYSILSNLNDLASAANPFQTLGVISSRSDGYLFAPQVFGEVNIIKGLSFRSQLFATFTGGSSHGYQQAYTSANFINRPRQSTFGLNNAFTYTWENYLSYNGTFGKHSISATAGGSYIDQGYSYDLAEIATNIANDNIQSTNPALTKTVSTSNEGYGTQAGRTKSLFGRLIYTYDGKYTVSGSMRRDGSSNFGPLSRYGNFPAAGFAWNFTEENFIKNSLSFLSDGKLRAGWGRTGNNRFGLGLTDVYTYAGVPSGSLVYSFGPTEQMIPGTSVVTGSNPFLRWEETDQIDAGLDLGFLKNRLTFTVDYYKRKSSGLISIVPLPGSAGVGGIARVPSGIYSNAADAENKGFEFSVGYKNVPQKNFNYSVSANFSINKNTTLALGNGQEVPIKDGDLNGLGTITYTAKGSPIGAFYGYRVDHVAKDQAEIDALNVAAAGKTGNPGAKYQNGLLPGDFIFKDLNGDGVVDSKDQEILGSPIPKYMYGFNAGASYKNFDFNLVLSGLAGVDIANSTKYYTQSITESHNTTTALLNRWRNPGDIAALPRAGQNASNLRPSDFYIEDGSYLRLRNVTVGYSIAAQSLKNLTHNVVSGLRVYVAAQNLLTVTNYSGYDPEISTQAGATGDPYIFRRGIDVGQLPQARTFIAGVQFQF